MCMKQLHHKVNIIPIIGKADTIARSELGEFKSRVSVGFHVSGGDTKGLIIDYKYQSTINNDYQWYMYITNILNLVSQKYMYMCSM